MIRFGPYLPDQPDLLNPGGTIAKNVLPRTAQSYGPFAGLSSVSDALTNVPIGAIAGRSTDGNVTTFICDGTNLYKLSGQAWSSVSKSTDAYSTPAQEAANFVQYGDRVIAALGHNDPLQSYLLTSSSAFADLAAAAPRARHIASIRDFVVAGNTWDSTNGAVANRVWWCAIDNPTDWPTPGSADAAQKQSDFQDLPTGGWVQGIVGPVGGLDGAVVMEKSIWRMQYEGAPLVFRFDEAERERGTPAPNSIVRATLPSGAAGFFYLGEQDFYFFNGAGSAPIGSQKVVKSFFADLDQNYFHRIYGAADPINSMVVWAYPGAGNTDGRPNRMLVYNWITFEWSYVEAEAELITPDLTTGYTLEELDAFGDIDSLPASLDSRIWTGGRLILSAFDSDKKLARFTGSNLAASFETQEIGGERRVYIDGIRPYVDAPASDITVKLRYRDDPGGTLQETTSRVIDADGMAHFTTSTRYARAVVDVAAGATWNHAQGIDADAEDDGDA